MQHFPFEHDMQMHTSARSRFIVFERKHNAFLVIARNKIETAILHLHPLPTLRPPKYLRVVSPASGVPVGKWQTCKVLANTEFSRRSPPSMLVLPYVQDLSVPHLDANGDPNSLLVGVKAGLADEGLAIVKNMFSPTQVMKMIEHIAQPARDAIMRHPQREPPLFMIRQVYEATLYYMYISWWDTRSVKIVHNHVAHNIDL